MRIHPSRRQIKPDVPISGIRLSDWLHRKAHDGTARDRNVLRLIKMWLMGADRGTGRGRSDDRSQPRRWVRSRSWRQFALGIMLGVFAEFETNLRSARLRGQITLTVSDSMGRK